MQTFARQVAAPAFAFALFSSAALIFALQPMFARMVTPLLGGSPSVWNTSMAFFQAALLLGYVYAHVLARIADLRVQAVIHALVLAGAWFVLPVRVSEMFGAPDWAHPAFWLVGVLAVSVGAPFAAASATAPLLQSWFARTGRADAHDPYYLYAASNLGSFLGLIAYPTLIEPLLGLKQQSAAWSIGFAVVCGLIALSAFTAIAAHGANPTRLAPTDEAPTWRKRLFWLAAAAIPSCLVLGVTLHITTDVASAPLLWVAPLGLYLATFVVAFSRGSEKLGPVVLALHAGSLAVLVASYFVARAWSFTLVGNLAGFFMSALVCHLALAESRPSAARLTEFYFWVSLGGVLGGAFAAFAAPVIFNNVYEYPIALAAAALFTPRIARASRYTSAAAAGAVAMALIVLMLLLIGPAITVLVAAALGAALALVVAGWDGVQESGIAPLRVAFVIAAGLLAGLVVYAGFNIPTVFVSGPEGALRIASPWNWMLLGVALACFTFIVHALAQPPKPGEWFSRLGLGAAAAPVVMLIALVIMRETLTARTILLVGLGACAAAMMINRGRPRALAVLVVAAFTVIFVNTLGAARVLTQARTFFGVLRTEVYLEASKANNTPELRVLMNGTTLHGAELIGAGADKMPLTYYNPNTALGEAVLGAASMGESSNVALIGLGAGTTACLLRPQDHLTIYEIDPMVVRLSGPHGSDFSYVRLCQPNARVALGDARLKIAEAPDGAYDVILVDAFSSDAIPAHLLTREAIALYLRKLSPRGIVVLHLSNRHLALVSESARAVRDIGAAELWRVSDGVNQGPAAELWASVASVMIVARDPDVLDRMPRASLDWREFPAPPGRAWSDDYINIARALWESLDGAERCRMYPWYGRCRKIESGARDGAQD